jgi:hypothetical protein
VGQQHRGRRAGGSAQVGVLRPRTILLPCVSWVGVLQPHASCRASTSRLHAVRRLIRSGDLINWPSSSPQFLASASSCLRWWGKAMLAARGPARRGLSWWREGCCGHRKDITAPLALFFFLLSTVMGDAPQAASPISFKCETQ